MKPPVSARIDDALGLTSFDQAVEELIPTTTTSEEVAPVCMSSGDPEADADHDLLHARQNLRTILEKAQDALDANIDFARQSDNPKAYEALAQILSAAVSASTALMGVNKTRNDIRTKVEKERGPQNVNNTVVFTTTNELLRLVREQAKVIDAEIQGDN